VISIGDVVKDIIRNLEHNVGDLIGYIMTDGPGGLTDEPRCCRRASGRENGGAPLTGHPPAAEETASYGSSKCFDRAETRFAPQHKTPANVRFGSKADIEVPPIDVRFTPKSGHWLSMSACPLCAESRHFILFSGHMSI
jgi:hypothetical protein